MDFNKYCYSGEGNFEHFIQENDFILNMHPDKSLWPKCTVIRRGQNYNSNQLICEGHYQLPAHRNKVGLQTAPGKM